MNQNLKVYKKTEAKSLLKFQIYSQKKTNRIYLNLFKFQLLKQTINCKLYSQSKVAEKSVSNNRKTPGSHTKL